VKKKYQIELVVISLILLISKAFCQSHIDVEAVAKFYFQVSKESSACVDGFATIVAGNIAPYQSHRSAGGRDTALVARTTDGTSMINWQTAPIPSTLTADSVNLIWVAGFGNNQGQEKFQLSVNDTYFFEFLTANASQWRIGGSNGGRLSFIGIATSRWGAYLGYMKLTLPARALQKNQALLLKVTGAASANEVWYRTYTYRDVLQFIRTRELKTVYDQVNFRNFGDVCLKLVAEGKWAGQHVELLSDQLPLAQYTFIKKGAIAIAEINIPRNMQEKSGDGIQVKLNGQEVTLLNLKSLSEQRIKAFLEEELVFDQYIFQPGKFPGVNWKRPGMVDNELGKFSLTTTYYDQNMTPVSTAAASGRYAAVVEGTTPAGFVVRRYVTLYCTSLDPAQCCEVRIRDLTSLGIQQEVWQTRQSEIDEKLSNYLNDELLHQPAAAILLAGLSEMSSKTERSETPEIRDRQWWIDFKHKNQPINKEVPVLKRPCRTGQSAKSLIENGGEASAFSAADIQRIREICTQWSTEAAEPLVTLIAHKGTVIFHEAFGTKANGEAMTSATPTWMASITKLLTGVLLMHFVDQGLVQLDAPIETYLPELMEYNTSKLTLRHLMTHTADLGWHGEWASDWNPALENYLAHCLPFLKVGDNFEYCRAGYAITGKIMERLTGRAVPYLFDEVLLKPLGMDQTAVDNTYGSMYSTCRDLARLGVSARDRIGPNYEQYERYVAQLIEAGTAPLKTKYE